MNARRIGVALLVLGILVNQYGYLHDLIWAKHAGAIYMGLKSYLVVVVGLAMMIAGGVAIGRSTKK